MKINKKVKLGLFGGLASVLLLAGCGEAVEDDRQLDTEGASGATTEKAPSTPESGENEKFELVYFEPVSNASTDLIYEIGLKKDDEFKYVRWDSDYIVEHILKDPEVAPYVIKDSNKMHIYRQPMMIYSEGGEIEATVEDKETVE